MLSEDVKSTKLFKKLGVQVQKGDKNNFRVYGRRLGSLVAKNSQLNFGNSGTLARLLIGILSTNPDIEIKVSGDHSLKKET